MQELAKVLCVDDENIILDGLERVLSPQLQVFKCSSGAEALQILANHPDIAVVVTDHAMPNMSGIQLLEKVRELVPTAVRVILSGQINMQEMIEAINNAQIHRFFLKPWDNNYLKLQVLEAVQTSQLMQENRRLESLSYTDSITGLPNRRAFESKLEEQIELCRQKNTQLSLLLIDVDHFKSYNEHYGHPEGDSLLASVASRISSLLRNGDFIARHGGEEFAVLLPNTESAQAYQFAEVLRSSLESKSFIGPFGRPSYVTISLGIATYPANALDAEELLLASDRALYQAKRQGRNQSVVASS